MSELGAMAPVVRLQGISKRFGGVQALDQVDFELLPGEVHALLGENGAGKSTLLKILEGVHLPDEGTIELFAELVDPRTDRERLRESVAMIFQELSLVPTLTVAQNVFLNREPKTKLGLIDDRRVNAETGSLLNRLGLDLDPKTSVERLSTGQRQLVEIAKALAFDARVLVLDEPTAALSTYETEKLFELLDRLREDGVSMIYVSHRMDEIFEIADRATVLRDGRHVVTAPIGELGPEGLVSAIVGKSVHAFEWKPRLVQRGPGLVPALRVDGLSGEHKPRNVTFELWAGEIVGVAGLMGSGRSELVRTLVGIDPRSEGRVWLNGDEVHPADPGEALRLGIVMIPEDRIQQGLVLEHSVARNISLPILRRLSTWGVIDDSELTRVVTDLVGRLRIKTASIHSPVRSLSGGNQQKTVIAKWLPTSPSVLLLDEPTKGIDIGSKAEIVHLVRELADGGNAVLLISSELPELLALSDRILVMADGEVIREIDRLEINTWVDGIEDAESRIAEAERRLQLAMQRVEAA